MANLNDDEEFEKLWPELDRLGSLSPLPGLTLTADPRAYADLTPYRLEAARLYSELLIDARRGLDQSAVGTNTRLVAEDLFERVLNEALWAMTEVIRGDECKYLGQRYISLEVHDRWQALAAARKSERRLYLDNADGKLWVRHEHVVPRELLKRGIRATFEKAGVYAQLLRSESCVVSVHEAQRLPDGSGWERYQRAKVGVWDRKTQDWLMPEFSDCVSGTA